MTRTSIYTALYRCDFVSFVPFAFGLLYSVSNFHPAYYIEEIAFRLQQCLTRPTRRVAITVPPRHLKSFTASIAYPAWLIAGDPRRRTVIICGTHTLRNELSAKLQDLVIHPRFRSVFPELKLTSNSRGVSTSFGGGIEYFVVSESIIGKGADVIIIDDPISPSHANDPRKLERLNQWYDDNVFQRLDDKQQGIVVLVMQRLAVNDLVGHLGQQDGWSFLRYPLIAEKDIVSRGKVVRKKYEPLNPHLGTSDLYCRAMMQMGARPFMAQYQQKPYPEGEGEARRGICSNLRKGKPWKVGDPAPFWAFANIEEWKILLHTVFGLGKHPWPDDMRKDLCEAEWILSSGSDEHRYDLIQLMTPEQRIAHGIDPSGEIFPDFTPYLSIMDQEDDEKSKMHNPDYRPSDGGLFKPLLYISFFEDEGYSEEKRGFDEPLDERYFDYVSPSRFPFPS